MEHKINTHMSSVFVQVGAYYARILLLLLLWYASVGLELTIFRLTNTLSAEQCDQND